jgi:histidine triad (HIT) family protein
MLLVVTDDHKLILHQRDNNPGVVHPGCWAGFGGAVEDGETIEEALKREMREETEIDIHDPIFLTEEFDYEGDGRLISLYYIIGGVGLSDIHLHEGKGIGVFEIGELPLLTLSPFVQRAIYSRLLPQLLNPVCHSDVDTADVTWSHEPEGYKCPFCENIATGQGDFPVEIVHTYDDVVVKMNPRWKPTNPGAVLVIPISHYENIYRLPDELGGPIQRAIRETAIAMKSAFRCEGVSTRQHNEPAGNQDVWHFHVHVFPRYSEDTLEAEADLADHNEMHRLAQKLRDAWPV